MFGDLTAAFGLTILCLAPIMLVSLGLTPLLMAITRSRSHRGNGKAKPRFNFIRSSLNYIRFYFVSLVVLVMLTIAFWWALIAFTGRDGALDFAAQNLPVERDVVEELIEPNANDEPSP